MSIYILFWLAAGGAALDHIDETFHGFKVHIPSNDDGSGGHVASEGRRNHVVVSAISLDGVWTTGSCTKRMT